MVIQTIFRKIAKTLVWTLLILALLFGVLVWRLLSGPVDVSFFKDNLAGAITSARDGRKVSLDGLGLEWLNDERRIVITGQNIVFYDQSGARQAQSARAEITLAGLPLLQGKLVPLELHLRDGQLSARKLPVQTGWMIGGETVILPDEAPEIETTQLIETIETALAGSLDSLRRQSDSLRIEAVSISDFSVDVFPDERPVPITFNAVNSTLSRSGSDISFEVSAESGGTFLPANARLSLIAPRDFSSLSAELSFADVAPSEIAGWLGFTLQNTEGLITDLIVGATIDQAGKLTLASAALDVGEGTLGLGDIQLGNKGSDIDLAYDRVEDVLTVTATEFHTSLFDGPFVAQFPDVFTDITDGRAFLLSSDALTLNFTPTFDGVWPFSGIESSGRIYPDGRRVEIDALTFEAPSLKGASRGSFSLPPDVEPGQIPFNLSLDVAIDAASSTDTVLRYWPVRLAPQTQDYLRTRVQSGTLTSARAQIRIEPNSNSAGHLADEALDVKFSVEDAAVQYLLDMPPIEGAIAEGHLTGNSFRLDVVGGQIASWDVETGLVHYPKLNPEGEDMFVEVKGNGDAGELLDVISQSRLQIEAKTGFDPHRIKGPAEFSYRMVRPASRFATAADMTMIGEGRTTGASFSNVFNNLDLVDGTADIALTEKGLTVTGYGDLGPSPVTFTWSNRFSAGGEPAKLQATATVNADLLNTFGIPGRAYLNGDVPLDLKADLAGTRFTMADVSFDLTDARVSLDEINWAKEIGVPANGRFNFRETETGPEATALFNTETAELEGTLTLAADGRVLSADLDRAFVEDRLDVSGTIRRDADNNVDIILDGAFFDASDLLGGIGSLGIDSTAAASTPEPIVETEETETRSTSTLSLALDVERLILDTGLEIRDADMTLRASADKLANLEATGTTSTGAYFIASFEDSGYAAPKLSFSTGDAGFVTSALFDVDSLVGGKLEVDGTLAYDQSPSQFDISLTDARLRNAPVFAQIISLASLQGLSDTLAGDGVLFTEVELPLVIDRGKFSVRGARASGPALGLTAQGYIDLNNRDIDVQGVLVPSFGINSALGGIPLIGDLVVGRRGEGIFSLTYSVDGTLEEARVAINPLSAVTPGILRRIFEAPDRDLGELEPRPEAPPPPQEPVIPDQTSDEDAPAPDQRGQN